MRAEGPQTALQFRKASLISAFSFCYFNFKRFRTFSSDGSGVAPQPWPLASTDPDGERRHRSAKLVDMFPDFSIKAMVLKTHSNGARAVPGSQQQRHAEAPTIVALPPLFQFSHARGRLALRWCQDALFHSNRLRLLSHCPSAPRFDIQRLKLKRLT